MAAVSPALGWGGGFCCLSQLCFPGPSLLLSGPQLLYLCDADNAACPFNCDLDFP